MTFLYFIPELTKQQVAAEVVVARGLGVPLRECLASDVAFQEKLSIVDVRHGPTGSSGVLIVALPEKGSPPAVGYYPDKQTWEDEGEFWLGVDNGNSPTPDGLQRERMIGGYEHELGDGLIWLCPTIRRAIMFPVLPQQYGRKRGEFTSRVMPEYEAIWQQSAHWASGMFSEDKQLSVEEQFDACLECLSLNYRVGPAEVSRLALLNDHTIGDVISAALDAPWLEEAMNGDQKKKRLLEQVQLALGSSSLGQEESTGDTTQAELTTSCSHLDTQTAET